MREIPIPISELPPNIFDEPDITDFIEDRQINPEDLIIIEALGRFPKPFFHQFHNFFNLTKDRSLVELEASQRSVDPANHEKVQFMDLLHQFAEKYDWATCWNLITIFERRKGF